MKLYKTFDSNNAAVKPVWTASQTEASKAKTAMAAELKRSDSPHRGVEYVAVEIDTKKEGLLAFLNS